MAKKMRVALANRAGGPGDNGEDVVASEREVDLTYGDVVERAAALEIVSPPEIYAQVQATINEVVELWAILWRAWAIVEGPSRSDWSVAIADVEAADARARQARDTLVQLVREQING